MKKRIIAMMLVIVMAAVVFPVDTKVNAEDAVTFSKSVQYKMTDARKILDLINQARTEANAEALDGISSRSPLVIDKDLEQVAMLRAAEIAVAFSHTRLDGSSCFSIYPATAGSKGENIAAGSSTYTATHNQWYSERQDYLNQTAGAVTGHYTNMIKSGYTRVGIAGCYVKTNDTVGYRYYWVECFGNGVADSSLTAPNDSQTTVALTATRSHLNSLGLSVEQVQDKVTTGSEATTEGDTTESKTTENKTTEEVTTEGKTTENKTTEKAATESKTTEEAISENKATEKATSENSEASSQNTDAVTVTLKKPAIKKLKNIKGGKCKVLIKKKIAGADGYQIRYSKNKNMKSSKHIKLSRNSILTRTIKGLKKGKKYYIQVRSFKKVNGKMYYSGWSGKKPVRIRK